MLELVCDALVGLRHLCHAAGPDFETIVDLSRNAYNDRSLGQLWPILGYATTRTAMMRSRTSTCATTSAATPHTRATAASRTHCR